MLKSRKIKSIPSLKAVTAALLLGAIMSLPANAQVRESHKHGTFFQNVAAEHVVPLLSGHVALTYRVYTDSDQITIISYTKGSNSYICGGSEENGFGWDSGTIEGVMYTHRRIRTSYPLFKVKYSNTKEGKGYNLLRYDSSDGGYSNYWYQNRRWWQMGKGHLQTELPALVYDLCPDFPSARKLGVRVNKKQTSRYYHELVAQDPGKRVRKPEYEAKEPPIIRLDVKGNPITDH